MISLLLNGGSSTTTTLYSAWFCPFAQRAWCALNELGVSYRLIESLKVDPATQAYIKDPGLLQANQKGLVPTLVQQQQPQQGDKEARTVVCDSMDILRELYCAQKQRQRQQQQQQQGEDNGNHVMEVQYLYQEAMEWNKLLCSTPFYSVLMKQDEQEREQAWKELQNGLAAFSEQLQFDKDDDGNNNNESISFYTSDFATGKEPSLVDFCVFPFVHRLYIIQHYKGLALSTTTTKHKIDCWRSKMEALPSVKATLADPKDLIPIYERYADGTAKSKVGDSIRNGTHVHHV